VQQVEGADGVLANPHLVLDLEAQRRAHEIPLLTGVELSELVPPWRMSLLANCISPVNWRYSLLKKKSRVSLAMRSCEPMEIPGA